MLCSRGRGRLKRGRPESPAYPSLLETPAANGRVKIAVDWSTCDLRDRSAATRLRTRGASTAEAQRPYAGRWSVASSDMWLLKTWSDPRESRQLGRATRGASQLGSVISVALRDVGSAWTGSWGVDPRHPSPVAATGALTSSPGRVFSPPSPTFPSLRRCVSNRSAASRGVIYPAP